MTVIFAMLLHYVDVHILKQNNVMFPFHRAAPCFCLGQQGDCVVQWSKRFTCFFDRSTAWKGHTIFSSLLQSIFCANVVENQRGGSYTNYKHQKTSVWKKPVIWLIRKQDPFYGRLQIRPVFDNLRFCTCGTLEFFQPKS